MQRRARTMSIDHAYTALYATSDGETHLHTVDVQLDPTDFAPPAQPLLVGAAQPAANCLFMAFFCGWGASDLANGIWHPAPRRLFGAILRGHIVTYASDGSSVRTGIGEVLLLEDVAPAKGHITVNPSTDEPCLVHIVQLPG
jgi:hypothetical protein